MPMLGFLERLKFAQNFCKSTSLVSLILVIQSQLTLTIVPLHFSSSHILIKLSISALLLIIISGFSKCLKRLFGVSASAPALVLFNVLFVWGMHLFVIQKAIPSAANVGFNMECVLLMIGFFSILASDPGWVTDDCYGLEGAVGGTVSDAGRPCEALEVTAELSLSGGSFATRRIRYCKSCKRDIIGFDHHCPAFGNCIGKNNHPLFMVLLVGFLAVEIAYIVSSTQFTKESAIMGSALLETTLSGNLVVSTMLFSALQVLWQIVFLMWHVYCICFNIKTEEWINWKKYPEFQLPIQSQLGESYSEMAFINPYDKGISRNIMEFLSSTG
ncbi:hypothetical protein Syun_002640 [Stephania yunnanensis]|uniref:S-acyltransferase n=1 Tax=Stephania yunnanensis TaxID=152371 RepID=A0AAP0Q7L7_9MAGN